MPKVLQRCGVAWGEKCGEGNVGYKLHTERMPDPRYLATAAIPILSAP